VSLLSRIAWPAGTSIRVIARVPERLPVMDSGFGAPSPSAEALAIRRWRDWAAAKILTTHAANRLSSHDLLVETEIYEGRLSETVLKRTKDLAVDLTVIGAVGFHTPAKFRLSPTADKLAHRTDDSVLVTRPYEQVCPLSTILAVDDSPEAWRAVEFVSALSLPNWAKVTVVNVAEKIAGDLAGVRGIDWPAVHYTSEKCIANAVEHLREWGAQVRRIIRFGHPADEILCAAQERNAALIVLGARDQSHTASYRLGDVAEKVVKDAPCSVLAVR
jgi:nucleotide-binding universal stress UspA family protein